MTTTLNGDDIAIRISKLDVARRQLRTAITLWFGDGDPVSIHTLACAAYEIIHFISRKRGVRRDLLFDTLVVKDEHQGAWAKLLKKPANFFKHANNDADATIDFKPTSSEGFIMFSLFALGLLQEPLESEESAFLSWFCFHKPHFLTEVGRERFVNSFPVEDLEGIRSLSKSEFFEVIRSALTKAER
jgi:hypothetical protein